MRPGWFVKTQSVFFAALLHVAVLLLLLISFSYTPELRPVKQVSIVNAVVVDKARVDEEIKRLKQAEEKKHQAEKQRVEELEKKLETEKKKAEEIKSQRLEEEQRLLKARKQKEEEQKKHEEMQQKIAKLEQQRKLEEEKKAKIETEKKKEDEKKRQEAEQAMQEQLEEEERKAQEGADQKLVLALGNEIHDKISRYFNLSGLPGNLSCKLRVNLLPSGEVVGVSILESSGNDIFDRRALTAVQKASPLPVPQDAETFERLNLRDSTFIFKP